MDEKPEVTRDGSNRIVSLESSDTDRISGPLGLWPFPILNLLRERIGGGGASVRVTEVVRDEQGRIQSIEEFER